MKIVLLTTETLHHAYFAREVSRAYPLALTLVEITSVTAPFPTAHPFEQTREDYERATWFADGKHLLQDHAETMLVPSMNDPRAAELLISVKPDLVLVFGTGILRSPLLQALRCPVLNLHGGDPQSYRGLDSHLWAIYHRDFSALVTTLHFVNSVLDDGDIVLQAALPIQRGMELYQLRGVNTRTCVELSVAVLDQFKRLGRVLSHPQRGKARYYSFMPVELKERCSRDFAAHTRTLPQ